MTNVLVHVVDDEEPVRRSMAFLLMASGYGQAMLDSPWASDQPA